PNGASSGSSRVNRGGGWFGPSTNLRGAYRGSTTPTDRYSYLGFRCAVSP
ncbi:SUMF1/EgtB/PvdO family nonheme iron enzyme, partial [bacterium]|nr:SUMF1/EgtB/PvdO family nonheme iron enzyme [bacterium]